MTKRIKLLIDPSGANDGVSFLIYRGETQVVNTDSQVMTVYERTATKRIQEVVKETLTQDEQAPLEFRVNLNYMWFPAPSVYLDGAKLSDNDIELFPSERKIRINNQVITPFTERVIQMSYSYLATEVEDDYTVSQLGVNHETNRVYSGIRKPVKPQEPYSYDWVGKELNIYANPDFNGEFVYYRVVAREDASGKISEPSDVERMHIIPNAVDMHYRLEKSPDNGKTWLFVKQNKECRFIVNTTEDITNNPPGPINVSAISRPGVATLTVENPWYNWQGKTRETHLYRVRAEDDRGEVSEFEELGKGAVAVKPMKIRIRRKEHNGTPASFSGLDAITMWEIQEPDYDNGLPTFELIDNQLKSGKTYSYTFYIDDERGFRSNPFYVTSIIP